MSFRFRVHYLLALITVVLFSHLSSAQGKGEVKGKVVDSLSSSPLGYTSIAIYSVPEKNLVNGNISDENGDFTVDVPFGRYYAETMPL